MTRRTKWIVIGSLVAVVVVVGSVLQNRDEKHRNSARAPYAATYLSPGNERLELHRDGTWVLQIGNDTKASERGESGGSILDESWDVVSAHGACDKCAPGVPSFKNFSGDRAIFTPTQVAQSRGIQNIRMYGDYYGIVNANTLIGADGRQWTRSKPLAAPSPART
jgi:hypothetical protein